jgi:diguanylate cyclase (GGDEF)-like protein
MEALKIDMIYPFFIGTSLAGILVYGKKNEDIVFRIEDIGLLADIIETAQKQIIDINRIKKIFDEKSELILTEFKNTYQVQLLEESKRLGAIRNKKDLCTYSVKLINRLLNSSQTKIFILDEDKKNFYDPNGKSSSQIKSTNYLIKYLTETKELVLASTLEKWAKEIKIKEMVEASQTAKELKASIIIPLIDITQVIGFLTISNKSEQKQTYTNDDILLLSVICDKIQTSLSNIYANEKANIDVLTGLHNRRYMQHRLESEIIKSYTQATPLSFVMIDVDEFKNYNDVGGHEEGDLVLEHLAQALQDTIRPTDKCFRYGGDEFCILLPNTTRNEAEIVAKRLKEEIRKHEDMVYIFELFHSHVEISMGTSTYQPRKAKEEYHLKEIEAIGETLIQKSDSGLINTKRKGKNNFFISEAFDKVKYEIDVNSTKDEENEED